MFNRLGVWPLPPPRFQKVAEVGPFFSFALLVPTPGGDSAVGALNDPRPAVILVWPEWALGQSVQLPAVQFLRRTDLDPTPCGPRLHVKRSTQHRGHPHRGLSDLGQRKRGCFPCASFGVPET